MTPNGISGAGYPAIRDNVDSDHAECEWKRFQTVVSSADRGISRAPGQCSIVHAMECAADWIGQICHRHLGSSSDLGHYHRGHSDLIYGMNVRREWSARIHCWSRVGDEHAARRGAEADDLRRRDRHPQLAPLHPGLRRDQRLREQHRHDHHEGPHPGLRRAVLALPSSTYPLRPAARDAVPLWLQPEI